MKVKLAAETMSNTVALAMESQGRNDTNGTVRFIKFIHRVFDCLNVSRPNQGKKGKKELCEYTSPTDWRFEFLENDFVRDYLERWEAEAYATVGIRREDQNRLLLSKQTIFGWKMTVKSFVTLSKELLQIEGVKFILSEKFSQDPLEEHFAKQRRKGGCNDNPTLEQFGRQELVLNVMNSNLITELRGNSNRNQDLNLTALDNRKLPKKKR